MTDTHYDKVEVLLPLNELVEKEYVEQYENETVLKMNMDGRYEDSADDPYINQVVLQMPMNGRVQDTANDPYANSVVLQMSMDGDNGSTNFIDGTGKTVTTYGNAQISTAQSKYYGSSGYFDGNGDYLTLPDLTDFEFTSGDFTIEGYIYCNGFYYFLGKRGVSNSGWMITASADSVGWNQWTSGNVYNNTASTNNFVVNAWNHFAVVRIGDSVVVYVNGIGGTPLVTANRPGSTTELLTIGRERAGSTTNQFQGYIQDLRITKGVARYTADFTPPTQPNPKITQVTLFPDTTGKTVTPYGDVKISNIQSKFGGYSAYFDGSGDYLTLPNVEDLHMRSSSFTIEFWMNPSSVTTSRRILSHGENVGSIYPVFEIFIEPSKLYFVGNSENSPSGGIGLILDYVLTVGTWVHVAIVRDGSNFYGFINGVKVTTPATWSSSFYAAGTPTYIGCKLSYGSPGDAYIGYIDDLRITKGVARYTSDFTPPTAPTKEVTQTSIWVDEKSHTVTPYGEATISNTQSKFGGYSAKFDGAGDYLEIPASSDYFLGTGDFTIEGWIYPETNFSTSRPIIVRGVSTDGYSLSIQATTGKLYLEIPNYTLASTNALTLNTWQHIAVVRVGSTISMYINGVLNGTTPVLDWAETSAVLRIGTNRGTPSTYFLGYMDDVRITKVSRYEAEFDPPTQFFEGSGAYWLPDYSKNDEDAPSYQLSLNTTTKKYDSGSIYFNGTTGYTRLQSIAGMSGKFCIEMWLNPDDVTGTKTLFGGKLSGFYIRQVDDKLGLYYGGANLCISGSNTLTADAWHHVAITRDAENVVRLFVSGVLKTSATFDKRLYWLATDMPYIGRDYNGNYFKGYLTDFRITAGESRYESTFTAPSKLIGTMGGTVTDAGGNPAVRKLFAVPRLSPTRIFGPVESSVDGTFSISVPNAEHVAVCLDNPSGALNALVFDRVVPVIEG
jgi:hypothetical protein